MRRIIKSEKITSKRIFAFIAAIILVVAMMPNVSKAADSVTATLTFSDSGITAEGESGYKIEGTALTINESGTYIIMGSCSEGSIKVKKGTTGVTLILKDLTLSSSSGAPVSINKENGDTYIEIQGTVTLTDNENPDDEDSTDEEVADAFDGAAIKVKSGSNLILSGSGTLNIDASECKNGIKGGEGVTITIKSGTYNINAANNGIASDGNLIVDGGTINVTGENDGLKSKPDADDTTSDGIVTINGGTITIDVTGEGIEGETVNINGGTVDITTVDDGINAATESESGTERQVTDLSINVTGGTLIVNSTESDGLDSNGSINLTGGNIVVWGATANGTGSDNSPLDSDGEMTIDGATVFAAGSGAMAEYPGSGSQTYITTGGSSGQGGFTPDGQNSEQSGFGPDGQNGEQSGFVPGGQNGEQSGFGPSGQNGEQSESDMSKQIGGMNTAAGTVAASKGSTIVVKDGDGNEVYSIEAVKDVNFILYSSPDTTSSYTISVDGSEASTTTEGQNGFGPNGQEGTRPGENSDSNADNTGNTTTDNSDTQTTTDGSEAFATYNGLSFYKDSNGDIRCYDAEGNLIIDQFVCDGTYTYYMQYDGTAMRDRLTYHPDGEHIIYFDSEGHEVFSDFAHVKTSIAGDPVDDYCFFNVYGYMYVDVITYDKTGTYLYYANPYGVMEMGKWFQFSDTVEWADGTEADGIAGGYGYADEEGKLLTNTEATDWEGRSCYLQGNGVALY